MAYIGIDLGTTYSAAAHYLDGLPTIIDLEGNTTLPSVISLRRNGDIVFGNTAKRNQAAAPQNTILEVKRLMGQQIDVSLGDQQFSPQELSAMILTRIKELAEAELGEAVEGAVISCPAHFMQPERAATQQAGELAGLNVLKLINEPTAAAYAYGVTQGTFEEEENDKEKIFLIYDLGGGTFDVTVIKMLKEMMDVIGTGGDPKLGGGNFDDCIVDWMLEKIEEKYPGFRSSLNDEQLAALKIKLKGDAEKAKIGLCNSQDKNPSYKISIANVKTFNAKPVVFHEILTMEEFETRIDTLLDNSFTEVNVALAAPSEKHGYGVEDITAILLVGGSTRIPLVRKKLGERFPNTEIRGAETGINPDEIVALGAAIFAATEASKTDLDAPVVDGEREIWDVTGHTLSVKIHDPRTNTRLLAPIIPKETRIPCKAAHDFVGTEGASRALVEVYQGESTDPNSPDVIRIGEFFVDFDSIPEATPLRIGLDLDGNGLLVAHATNLITQTPTKASLNYNDSAQMSPEEVKANRKKLEEQMNQPINQRANPLDPSVSQQNPFANVSQEETPADQTSSPASGGTSHVSPADPTQNMNPILRGLYNKAISNFASLPMEKQGPVIALVGEAEAAATANDQQAMMKITSQLSALTDGA